jgi:hypothetical protein
MSDQFYRFYVSEHPDYKDAWAVYGKPATSMLPVAVKKRSNWPTVAR